MEEIKNQQEAQKPKKESSGCLIVGIMFFVFLIIAGIILFFLWNRDVYVPFQKPSDNDNEIIRPITKTAPNINIENTLTGIILNIQCNDNYDYVILKIDLFDKNYNIVKSFTLRENTMKKGELRQVEYKLSLEEAFSAKQVRATVQEYK